MEKFQRLNGKWKINDTDDDIFGKEDDYHKITSKHRYYPEGFDLTGYISKKDALLISKAPEMLEMLEYFVENNMLSITGEEMAKQLIKEATDL